MTDTKSARRPRRDPNGRLATLGDLLGAALAGLVIGVVGDLVFHHRAVQVVDAEVERELRDRETVHDPKALDVWHVVEHQAGDGEGLQRLGG